MLWLAVTAGAVQATYHHRPGDVLGSTLLACACYGLAARLLPPSSAAADAHPPRTLTAVALAPAAVGALLAGARSDSVAPSLIFAAAAFACAPLLWRTTAHGPVLSARRAPHRIAHPADPERAPTRQDRTAVRRPQSWKPAPSAIRQGAVPPGVDTVYSRR